MTLVQFETRDWPACLLRNFPTPPGIPNPISFFGIIHPYNLLFLWFVTQLTTHTYPKQHRAYIMVRPATILRPFNAIPSTSRPLAAAARSFHSTASAQLATPVEGKKPQIKEFKIYRWVSRELWDHGIAGSVRGRHVERETKVEVSQMTDDVVRTPMSPMRSPSSKHTRLISLNVAL